MTDLVRLTEPTGHQLPGDESNAWAPQAMRRGWRIFARNRPALIGLVTLFVIVLASFLGPILSPYEPLAQDVSSRLQAPSWSHPMGTDELGRDTLTRVLLGGRQSLAVAGLATAVALAAGVLVGVVAGYYGRWADGFLMRLVDLALSLPDLFLLILAGSLFGPSFWTMVVIIGLVRWMNVARLVRGSFLSLREQEFVEAARAVGARPWRIIIRHLLANSISPVIVAGTLLVASAIIAESTLSFLGLGLQPPTTSWGSMLRNTQTLIFSAPWAAVFPGLMIFLTVISINFVGDGLRDVFDPEGATRAQPDFKSRLSRLAGQLTEGADRRQS